MESRGRARERVDHDHAAASRSQSSKREVTFPRGGASKEGHRGKAVITQCP